MRRGRGGDGGVSLEEEEEEWRGVWCCCCCCCCCWGMMGDDAEVVEVRKGTKMVEMDRRERIVVWLCMGVGVYVYGVR